MRINKLLSNYGYCSRKEANRLIEEKRVYVNGLLSIKGQWVEEDDKIFLDNKPIIKKEKVYLAFNKPTGITCTSAKEVEENIIDYIDYKNYIFPVGRLDKESEGLILLTNDGDLADKVLNSKNHHEKEYIVKVDKVICDSFIQKMSNGVNILGIITRHCIITKINEDTFKIILTQGINKQIRRMCKALGYKVIKLKRVRIVNINIEGLEVGKFRNLSFNEIKNLKEV